MKSISPRFSFLKIFLVLAAASLLFGWLSIGRPFGTSQLMQISGGISPLDMRITYSPATVFSTLTNLGKTGREFYKNWIILDYINAFFSMLFQTAILLFLVHRLQLESGWRFLCLFPIMKWISDCAENTILWVLLSQFPSQSIIAARISACMTFLKWLTLFITLVSILVLAFTLGRKMLVAHFKNHTTI